MRVWTCLCTRVHVSVCVDLSVCVHVCVGMHARTHAQLASGQAEQPVGGVCVIHHTT